MARKTSFRWFTNKTHTRLTKKAKSYLSTKAKIYWVKVLSGKITRKGYKLKLWRFSFAINFPIHKKYFGALGQIWSNKKHTRYEDFIMNKLEKFLVEYLKYSRKDFWFKFVNTGQGWQQVRTDKRIKADYWECRLENDTGTTVKIENGILKHSGY